MSCKQKRGISLFLFVATSYFYALHLCGSVSSRQWEDVQESASTGIKQDKDAQQGHWRLVEQVIRGPHLRSSNQPGLHELRPKPAPKQPLPHFTTPKRDEPDISFTPHSLSWTTGNVSTEPRSKAPDSEDGYQADDTGFQGVQGQVLGLSSESSPHFSEWQAIRPLVGCDESVMTFTASSQEFTHLLVDREGASPISVFQLPPYCGFTVRKFGSDLEMLVPYDACYITKENGSYVLPMLWWGNPVKLSCPMLISTSAPLFSLLPPSVLCSPYGMVVQILEQKQDIPELGVIVNGAWGPFVSEQCAYRVDSQSQLTFFIFFGAPCITYGDGLHVQLTLDDQEYILSCPVSPQFPYVPSPPWSPPSSPGDPQFPYIPDPVSPVPTSPPPPQPPTQEPISQLPDYPHYPGLQYLQLPQVYPPGPQHPGSPQPTPGSPPGPQPQQQQQQQFLYPAGHAKFPYFLGGHQKYPSLYYRPPASYVSPVQDRSPHQVSTFPGGSSQYPFGLYYPDIPFYYRPVTPAPTPAPQKTSTTTTTTPPTTQPPTAPAGRYYPQYYLQIPYYPAPTAAPVTQAPAPLPPSPQPPPSSPLKQPVATQYQVSPFYPPVPYHSYYPYWSLLYQKLSTSHHTTTPPPSPPTTDSPSYPSSQFHLQRPIYLQPRTKEEPQKPVAPQPTCPPYTQTMCGYPGYPNYPYYQDLYQPHYHPPYPPVPQYPDIQLPMTTKTPSTTTTTAAPSTTSFTAPPWPTPQMHHVDCQMGRMVVYLPSTHPHYVLVKDQLGTWLYLSSVDPRCGYILHAKDSWVILETPLPPCHSQLLTPTTISLSLRFLDTTMAFRTVDLECPYQSTPETPVPVTPLLTPPSPTKGKLSPPVVPKPKFFCSSHQMTVELPSGSISGIYVKDIKGNRMNLQEAPKHCGYSASEGEDGKIHLRFQLHSRCHMSVQGKMYIISVIFMTVNGRKETQFSCPVVIPGSAQECNLPSEQRLPCGSSSVSQPQCLSIGCCFNKHPPACYYPMDECTIDRHFVFSVPASLTEPPLSPALLVAASNFTCKPQRVTSDYALFKIPMDGCGTRRVMVGKTLVYMVEIINKVQTISLNYGTITRDSPVRLLVECRFVPGTVLTVSYVVKTPTLGSHIQVQGVFGVQLRISKDAMYSSYYPQYHQPLQMLLGKPLYLEVRLLNSPDPSLVLLVHYCLAYPRSGNAVWVLVYNGCPNPLDPASPQPVLSKKTPSPQGQVRRFNFSTFQFLPDGEFKNPDEEIYFMCSTEICSPHDRPCIEECFDQLW